MDVITYPYPKLSWTGSYLGSATRNLSGCHHHHCGTRWGCWYLGTSLPWCHMFDDGRCPANPGMDMYTWWPGTRSPSGPVYNKWVPGIAVLTLLHQRPTLNPVSVVLGTVSNNYPLNLVFVLPFYVSFQMTWELGEIGRSLIYLVKIFSSRTQLCRLGWNPSSDYVSFAIVNNVDFMRGWGV